MDKQAILDQYIRGMGVSQNRTYIKFVERFLDFADALDRDNILSFTKKLHTEGYSAGSIELWQRTIRSCFKRNGLDWPLLRGENASIGERDEEAIALSPATIKVMVDGALAGKFDINKTFALALSTTYGVRAAEIRGMTPDHIDLKGRSIYVETKKHGRERFHHIPEVLVPVFEQVLPHYRRASETTINEWFHKIEEACGIDHFYGTGWHAIRRSLDYGLIESGLTELSVKEFMRWGKRSRTDMVSRYHKVRFVGVDKEMMELGYDKTQDEAVFEKHPFLPFWGGVSHAKG